jgi:cell wall assembly regulator SMI1
MTAAALNDPADDATLTAVQRELGQVWTDDLISWLAVSNGAERDHRASIIPPFFIPLSVSRIQSNWQMLTSISQDLDDAAGLAASEDPKVAGTRSFHFLRQWVPIAENTGGDFLFVDLRDGDRRGAVYQFWRDDAFHGTGAFWASVRAMATSIADALEGGLWAPDDTGERDMEPTVTDGAMEWTDADEWETLGGDERPDGGDRRNL